MQRFNIINGFHCGEPSNTNGIGKWLQKMADNNLPFSAKATNGTASLVDAQNLVKAGHEGFLVWRKMYGFAGMSDDVPIYGSDIETEADRYWTAVLRDFPADLDKNLVFVELINEPDKNWVSWLGYLGRAIGERAVRDGYKVLLFGWSGGTPEYEHWQTPGMEAFLRYCAEYPDNVGLSLHEYSFTTQNLTEGYPYLLGRFWMVHEACDTFGISYPTIYISEFGYTYNDFPTDLNQIALDFTVAGEIYAQFPNIKGAAIWALDKVGWNGIDKKVHKLMWDDDTNTYSPLVDIIVNNPYEVDDPQPPAPDETLGEFLERIAEENRVINYNTLAALELAMVNDGYVPYGNEKWATYEDGTQYAIQGARRLGIEPPDRRVYYAKVGEWDNVLWVKQGNEPELPPVEEPLLIYDIVDELEKHPTKTYAVRKINDISSITVHHTVGVSSPQNIAYYHVHTNDWPGIGYHYVIEQNGKISMTNYPTTISYHAGVVGEQNNDYALGIALVGNFTSTPPTQAQIESARKLIDYLKETLPRAKYVLPHRHMPGQTTACPGAIWDKWFDQITQPVILGQPVSIKFIPNETVEVTSTTLNVRNTPNGTILKSKPLGSKGTVLYDSPINAGGFDWWKINWADVIGWSAEDYLKPSGGSVIEPPPTVNKVDLLPYIKGNGVLYEVKNAYGSQERFQSQTKGVYFLQTKNTRAESFFLKDGYIYRDWDTSPGNNRFYRLEEGGVNGSPWVPQKMAIGEEFTRSRRVQFYNWNCTKSDLNSGNVTDTMKFVAKYDNYTFRTGITLQNVIELHWSGGEKYFYSYDYGLVAWERLHFDPATPQWSAISEIHAPGQRPDNIIDLPDCLK